MAVTIEVVSSDTFSLGECPNWLPQTKSLAQVDAFAGDVVILNPETKESRRIHIGDGDVTFVVACASDPKNRVVVSEDRKILRLELDTEQTQLLDQVELDITDVKTRFNDAKCDANGRLWAGTMALESAPTILEKNRGSLYSYDGRQVTKRVGEVTLSNGMDWSIDGKVFYYIDSVAKTLDAFDFDMESGQVSNRRNILDYKNEEASVVPDGMCIDNNDNLWVACYNGSKVICVDPKTGETLKTVKLPASKITSCCFGGEDYSELYVTSAWFGLADEQKLKEPQAGATFRVTGLGVKGFAANFFKDT